MSQLFGTDGIRGEANKSPIDAETLLRLGQATGQLFRRGNRDRHRAVIGKDTRLSGYMIETALVAGLTSTGMDVCLLGPLPTPAVAFITRAIGADLGVMISASHNGFRDNGVKLFAPDGYKLSGDMERRIEAFMDKGGSEGLAPPEEVGRARRIEDARQRYVKFAKDSVPQNMTLSSMRIVVDCAHGAAYKIAPQLLEELGAEVILIGCEPDGLNINEGCGSTDTRSMRSAVREHGADIGIAFDGDADRLIIADEKGRLIDGDHILAFLASSWKEREILARPGIVATILSSLGLERYLQSLDLSLMRTPVGDRHVAEHMRSHGFNLGGERSGHLLMSDFSTTGDGLISALQFLSALTMRDLAASAAIEAFTPPPHRTRNVRLASGASVGSLSLSEGRLGEVIAGARRRLGARGRLIIRPSGTEPVIRVMGEGDDGDLLDLIVGDVAEALERSVAERVA